MLGGCGTVRQLPHNYDVLRRQATQSFVLVCTFMTLDILVILAGSVGEMFDFAKEASNITTIAGVVVEVISGFGLYLFKQTSESLNITSDRLHDTWKTLWLFLWQRLYQMKRNQKLLLH